MFYKQSQTAYESNSNGIFFYKRFRAAQIDEQVPKEADYLLTLLKNEQQLFAFFAPENQTLYAN